MLLEEKTLIKNYKKSVKESFLAPILILLFGIVLLRNPENFFEVAINIFGYGAVFVGILNLVLYFRLPYEQRILKRRLMSSALLISFGIVAFFEAQILKEMMTILLGGYLVFQNASRLELSMNLQKYTKKLWIYLVGVSIFNILLALLLMINPFSNIALNTYISILLFIVEIIFFIENVVILIGVRYEEEKE